MQNNSKAREWRHDSDKQTEMADDLPKTILWNKNFT